MASCINIYTRFFTRSHIYIKGRLLKGGRTILKPDQGYLLSFYATFIRSMSREIKNHPISISFLDQRFNISSDEEGYFELLIPNSLKEDFKADTKIKLALNYRNHDHTESIFLNPYIKEMPLGIISDIDDTLMVSFIKSFLKIRMLIQVIFFNPFRRKPMRKAVQFYHQKLESLKGSGPIIYVSNSPWNMYDYLKVFLDYNEFPEGEIQLRDFGWHMIANKYKTLDQQNKYLEIQKLFQVFQNTNFILIGDSAEKDFYIYTLLLERYPKRVKEIIIIKAGNKENEKNISQLLLRDYDIPITLADSYDQLI